MPFTIKELRDSKNIAKMLDDETLQKVGEQVKSRYDTDLKSLGERHKNRKQAVDLAMQIAEIKSEPWDGAANVKLPLIARAVVNYASRAYPEIINRNNLVKSASMGADPQSFKFQRGYRVCKTINFQNCYESNNWKRDTDKLLTLVAVLGTVFRKSRFNVKTQKIETELCLPTSVIINANASNITECPLTHVFERNKNHIVTEFRRGNYIIPRRYIENTEKEKDQIELVQMSLQKQDVIYKADDFIIELAQQQCWIDLDEDGYAEPYLVTFDKNTGEVFQIVNRFHGEIEKDSKGNVIHVQAENCYNDYHFLPSFDGNFYSIGFGEFLLPLNHAINDTTSHILNAAKLANSPPTIIGSGLRFEEGEYDFGPGKCMRAQYNMDNGSIANSIYTFPKNEPSSVLYQLLQFLTSMCNDLTSITDVMQGKQPLQNVAQGTYAQSVEQGTKVYTAINMRLLEGFTAEYRRQYDLNSRFLSADKYMKILDDPLANKVQDFDLESMDIYPVSDPQFSTAEQRLNLIQILRSAETRVPYEIDKYLYESVGIEPERIKTMLNGNPPPPSADEQKKAADAQLAQARAVNVAADATLSAEKVQQQWVELNERLKLLEAQTNYYQAASVKAMKDAAHNEGKELITATKMANEQNRKEKEMEHKQRMDQANLGLAVIDRENDRLKIITDADKPSNNKVDSNNAKKD